jgi:hypothetical protein
LSAAGVCVPVVGALFAGVPVAGVPVAGVGVAGVGVAVPVAAGVGVAVPVAAGVGVAVPVAAGVSVAVDATSVVPVVGVTLGRRISANVITNILNVQKRITKILVTICNFSTFLVSMLFVPFMFFI